MLHGAEPDRDSLFLAPVQEASQPDPELEEAFEVFIGNMNGHRYIVSR